MTTLAANTPRIHVIGDINEFGVIASDIIYEGAAVGVLKSSGYAQPLLTAAGDVFVGFAESKADNSSGSAGDINVRVKKKGAIKLSVTGAVITDIDLPVYASDDNTFSFVKTSGVFIGFTRRYVSSGVMEVEYDVDKFVDPHEGLTAETVSANKTLDNQDTGKVLFIDTDGVTITAPAVAAMAFRLVNAGAYGTVGWDFAPNANDLVIYKDSSGTDNHGLENTKATACRGDYLDIEYGDATGWIVRKSLGTFADKDNS